jgi:hypothetical protein
MVDEIRPVEADGELGKIVATSDKVGFCMLDIEPIDKRWRQIGVPEGLDIRERRLYGQCGWRRQGISTGWVDTYEADTPGQSLDVTGLPAGLYALISTVDPDGVLYEADRTNNTAVVYFYLDEARLRVIGADLGQHLPSAIVK